MARANNLRRRVRLHGARTDREQTRDCSRGAPCQPPKGRDGRQCFDDAKGWSATSVPTEGEFFDSSKSTEERRRYAGRRLRALRNARGGYDVR